MQIGEAWRRDWKEKSKTTQS